MIALAALLVVGSPASEVATALARCPRVVACLARHVDTAGYVSRVLVDLARTSTTPLDALSVALAAHLEARLTARAAQLPRGRCAVEPEVAPSGAGDVVVALSCGEHRVRLLGASAVPFRVADVEVDGVLVSRSHRAEVNKAARRWGVAALVRRLAPRGRALDALELGLGASP